MVSMWRIAKINKTMNFQRGRSTEMLTEWRCLLRMSSKIDCRQGGRVYEKDEERVGERDCQSSINYIWPSPNRYALLRSFVFLCALLFDWRGILMNFTFRQGAICCGVVPLCAALPTTSPFLSLPLVVSYMLMNLSGFWGCPRNSVYASRSALFIAWTIAKCAYFDIGYLFIYNTFSLSLSLARTIAIIIMFVHMWHIDSVILK